MFNDHLIFSNNIYDAAKHIQQLQEAGLKQAMKPDASYDARLKELIRTLGRIKHHQEEASKLSGIRGKELEAHSKFKQAELLGQNVMDLTPGDSPKRKFWAQQVGLELGPTGFDEPTDMSPNASDGPDVGEDGSTEEVQVDAEERSFGTDPRARAIRQQPPMRSSTGPTAQDIAAIRFGVGRTRKYK